MGGFSEAFRCRAGVEGAILPPREFFNGLLERGAAQSGTRPRAPWSEALTAGLCLALADVLAAGFGRVPLRLLLASAALGMVFGVCGLVAAKLMRSPASVTGWVFGLGALAGSLSMVSKHLEGGARMFGLLLAGLLSLAAGWACWGARRRSLAGTFLLMSSVPAASFVAWSGDHGFPSVAFALALPLIVAWVQRPRALDTHRFLGRFAALAVALALARIAPALDPAVERPDLVASPASTTAQAPDLMLLVIDTLRADALGETAPGGAFDRLTEMGVRFENCISSAPWTLPSMSSILTSLHPSQHGATNANLALPLDVTTLAEALRADGYQTAAFTGGAFVAPAFRLDQGFEHFDAECEFGFRPYRIHVPLVWRLAKNRYLPFLPLVRWVPEFRGFEGASRAAQRWLVERDRQRPCFLLVHSYEVHDYYLYHPDPDDDLAEGEPGGRFRGRLSVHPEELQSASQADLDRFKQIYAARLRNVELGLDSLIESFRASGPRDAVVLLTSDHGEGFDAARGRVHHGGRLHDDLLRVPLLLYGPGRIPEGRRVSDQVRSIDVMPTLLELAGVEAPAGIAGESLLPLLLSRDARAAEPRDAWSEEHTAKAEWLALRTREWKLVRGERVLAYRLPEDPLEEHPRPAAASRLEDRLLGFSARFPRRDLEAQEIDPSTRAHLRALGYVE